MARLRWHRAVALATALVGVATGFVARAPPAAGGARHRRGVARSADLPWSNDAGADSPAQAERVVGCMPFDVRELLLPGQSRYLHLYEARFISLFEEAHLKGDRGAIACSARSIASAASSAGAVAASTQSLWHSTTRRKYGARWCCSRCAKAKASA